MELTLFIYTWLAHKYKEIVNWSPRDEAVLHASISQTRGVKYIKKYRLKIFHSLIFLQIFIYLFVLTLLLFKITSIQNVIVSPSLTSSRTHILVVTCAHESPGNVTR